MMLPVDAVQCVAINSPKRLFTTKPRLESSLGRGRVGVTTIAWFV
jgi:hypothetical protein